MAVFSVRVELHKADDYRELHKFMEVGGFKREVDLGGKMHHLPTGEYSLVGDFTAEQVVIKAKVAATKTLKVFSLLVTESKTRKCFNLTPVVPKKPAD